MTPKEAWQKICPMMWTSPNTVFPIRCKAYGCAVWEVDQTKETIFEEERPKGDGWENIAKFGHEWTRPIPIEEQPGQCGIITK